MAERSLAPSVVERSLVLFSYWFVTSAPKDRRCRPRTRTPSNREPVRRRSSRSRTDGASLVVLGAVPVSLALLPTAEAGHGVAVAVNEISVGITEPAKQFRPALGAEDLPDTVGEQTVGDGLGRGLAHHAPAFVAQHSAQNSQVAISCASFLV